MAHTISVSSDPGFRYRCGRVRISNPKLSPVSSTALCPSTQSSSSAAYDHSGLLARVRVGLFTRSSARRQPAEHQLEVPLERRAEQLIDDSRREVDSPPPRAANYQSMLVRADGVRLEKPANRDAECMRD